MANEFNNFKINFDDDDNDNDIYSSSASGKDEYEDISSDSGKRTEDEAAFIDFYSFSNAEDISSMSPRKKKHGFAGFLQRVNEWWSERKGYQKAAIILLITLFTFAALFVIWNFLPLELRGKLFCSAFGLMVLNLGVFLCVRWKKRRFQTVIMSFFSILLCAVMIITLFFWLPFLNLIYNFDHSFTNNAEELAAVDPIDKNITNIALFGIDTRDTNSFSGNSDSIMILSINAKSHTVKIISVMRDSLVPIERNGSTIYSKINSAYSRGGAELAVRTLNSIFDLDITEYATVNFFGMAKIIDAVGGIEAELTEREVTANSYNNYGINSMIGEVCQIMGYDPADYYVNKSGKQLLNGIQAVAYSRIRYVPNIWGTNNDYGRTDRQRYVMEQLFNKALTMRASSYPGLIKALIPYTVTSLSPDEILSFAFNIMTKSPTFKQERLPHDDYLMTSPSGSFGSVVYYDLDFASELIHSFIYDDVTFDDYVAENGISKYDWYRNRYSGSSGNSGGSSNTTTKPSTSNSSSSTGNTSSGDIADDDFESSSELTGSDYDPDSDISSSTGSTEGDNSSSDSSSGGSSEEPDDTDSSDDSSGGAGETGGGNTDDNTSSSASATGSVAA